MGEDASLDQFIADEPDDESDESDAGAASADTEPATESSADAAPATDDGDAADGPVTTDESEAAAVEPARTTYTWDGAGAACDACGETVERRWQGDGGLVCPECKDWDRP